MGEYRMPVWSTMAAGAVVLAVVVLGLTAVLTDVLGSGETSDRRPALPCQVLGTAANGAVTVYRCGVPTADDRVAECLVTDAGAIHCHDVVEDAW